MDKLNLKLRDLLQKYGSEKEAELCGNTLFTGGKKIPLLPWRRERRFTEMKNIIASPYFEGMSMYRAMSVRLCSANKREAVRKEIDLFGWLTGDDVAEIFTVRNDVATNLLIKSKKGYVGVIELGFTLRRKEAETDKHEAISSSGIVCDKAIDTQYRQRSVYLFSEEEETYTDNDFELFGLDEEEVALVRQAFDVITGKDKTDYEREYRKTERLLQSVELSHRSSENILVKEEE
ncbi:MAG: hypothetical protein SPH68_06940 [Candidatus Borkfalkiaceae bacterium]|nr:hypothetical protein [Clostridia bacterium]MDY6223875.1 hypothetical protein [Christensenellaceae bacterium]